MGNRQADGDRVMAAFCHPRPEGARFNDAHRGVWYCAAALRTALAETIFHRSEELREIGGWYDTTVQMADYRADFNADFHDIRGRGFSRYLQPDDYRPSQEFGQKLLEAGSNGIIYPSVRDRVGQCLGCFRPRLVSNVKPASVYEYKWSGNPTPAVRKL